jgi:hypothetical protein
VSEEEALGYMAVHCATTFLNVVPAGAEVASGPRADGPNLRSVGPDAPTDYRCQNLHLWLELNGKRIQDSSTSD